MRSLTTAAFLTGLYLLSCFNCGQADAQLHHRSKGTQVINYQPSDPWKRGRWFNIQTGNSGLFYNCDGEQAKRNSPYICWKPDDEKHLPPLVAPWVNWHEQMDEVRQRIYDGACGDLCCSCRDCHRARKNGVQAGCAACVQANARSNRYANNGSVPLPQTELAQTDPAPAQITQLPSEDPTHGTKFGLVRGKIVDPPAPQVQPQQFVAPQPITEAPVSVAKKSLIEQLRQLKRR